MTTKTDPPTTDPAATEGEAPAGPTAPRRTNELVRARLESGIETNIGRLVAEEHGLEILDEPAQVAFGKPRPATREGGRPILPTTTVDEEATKKAASKPAGGSKA